MSATPKTLVYPIRRYEYLAEQLCADSRFEAGFLERRTFADGERWLRVGGDLRGRDAVLIGGTVDDQATLELFDLACGLVGQGINTLCLAVPYFGYSTQERAVLPGEVVTAKSRATLLSAIPRASLANEIVMLDLHTPGIAHYFESHVHSVNLSARRIALRVVQGIAARGGETVVACTDAGRAKWVQGLANEAGLEAAFVYKARRNGETSITGVNADVAGKNVVIYDDMVRSGGSLLHAAQAYKDAGAVSITAVTTHAVLPDDALSRLRASGLIEALYCTDSLPQARTLQAQSGGFLKVQPALELYLDYLTRRLM